MFKYLFWILGLILVLAGVFMFLIRGTAKLPTPPTTADAPVRLLQPQSGDVVSSPLNIRGEALGTWFFEANLPIKLVDNDGKVLVQSSGMATADWMTTDYVPFTAKLEFVAPTASTGFLIFAKDNPSGLPELDDEYKIGVRFR